MEKTSSRKMILVVLVALAVGWWLGGSSSSSGPFGPGRKPRPVLAAIVKVAKNLLWFSLVFEPPPDTVEARVVMAPQIGEDGFPIVDHGRGW